MEILNKKNYFSSNWGTKGISEDKYFASIASSIDSISPQYSGLLSMRSNACEFYDSSEKEIENNAVSDNYYNIESPVFYTWKSGYDYSMIGAEVIDYTGRINQKNALVKKLAAEESRVKKCYTSQVRNKINDVIDFFVALDPRKVILQLTSSDSAFFRIFFGQEIELHFELFLNIEDGLSAQTMFIIYLDDDAVVTGSRGCSEAFEVISTNIKKLIKHDASSIQQEYTM